MLDPRKAEDPAGAGSLGGDETTATNSISGAPAVVKPLAYFPAELRALPVWVCWKWGAKHKTGKPTKLPVSALTGRLAESDNSTTWAPLDVALAYCEKAGLAGVGFMFPAGAGYVGVDLDHTITDGVIAPEAHRWIDLFGSYAEKSVSGTGVHVLCKGALPGGAGRKNARGEIYTRGRFFVVTGRQIAGTPATLNGAQAAIDTLLAEVFPDKAASKPSATKSAPALVLTDGELIGKASAARNGDKFDRLWAGDTAGYSSQSEADAALCSILAFWTGRDASAMDRLFRASGLMRDKWDEKHGAQTYGELTIRNAAALCDEVYAPGRPPESVPLRLASSPGAAPASKAPQLDAAAYIKPADVILATNFPELEMLVPDILPDGLTILAGRPKVGKSWLALQLAYSVTSGGMLFGRKVGQGRVLYFALEDSERRLQKRMQAQNWLLGLPCDFVTLYDFRASIGDLIKGHDKLRALILGGGYRLVVIDTLGRALMGGDPNDPDLQTRALDPLQGLAAEFGVSVLVLDHHRKTNGIESDLVSDILGATAKAAIADAIWGLYREQGKKGRKLAITGRDIEDAELALTFDVLTRCYQCEGNAGEVELTQRQKKVLAVMADYGNATLTALAVPTGLDKGNLYRVLQDLLNSGQIIQHGAGHGASYEVSEV